MKKHAHPIFLILIALATQTLQADITLNRLFSDGMVIQRETVAPVWGWADPGESVKVSASWGAKAQTTANDDGTWSIELDTPPAGGPHTLHIQGSNSIEIHNVLSGEVWFCGGQSNMKSAMKFIAKNALEPKYQPIADYVAEEMRTANDQLLRQIEVKNARSPYTVKDNFTGSWQSVKPEYTAKMTATGYFFARELRTQLNVPVGLINCSFGGTRVQPWISEAAYRSRPGLRDYYEQEMARLRTAASEWKSGREPVKRKNPERGIQWPATLHKGMVASVQPYAIKGVIWYQGESNARRHLPNEYENYFCALITSWRKEWNQGDFPFYWVQLANHGEVKEQPQNEDSWATICDQQRRCLVLPNTGMAVANDIGETKDIHPHNKPDVGRRLANWALAKDYGITLPVYSGPLYKSHSIEGRTVSIRFSEVGTGLMVGHKNLMDPTVEVNEPLKRFQIAGSDRNWKWANASIVSNDTIEVSHPDVENPVVVRYAWAANPEGANLYNKAGLPASIFTTE